MRISKENRFAIYGVVFYGGIALNSSLRENPCGFSRNDENTSDFTQDSAESRNDEVGEILRKFTESQ